MNILPASACRGGGQKQHKAYIGEWKMNYYQVLGVAENADTEAIKRAYRKLVKECHPDTHPGSKKAEERFKQVSEAYAVLIDENKRREYDGKNRSGKGVSKNQPRNKRQTVRMDDFAKEFYDLFGFAAGNNAAGGQNTPKEEKRRNPIDTSGIFEKYMGFK